MANLKIHHFLDGFIAVPFEKKQAFPDVCLIAKGQHDLLQLLHIPNGSLFSSKLC